MQSTTPNPERWKEIARLYFASLELEAGRRTAFLAGAASILETGAPQVPSGPGSTSSAVVVGTPSYMSPEQVSGAPADTRTDIWAFGCVLYEVLTGRRAFDGDSVPDRLTAVQDREPDWSPLSPNTPPRIADFLRRCLQKKPHWRLRDIGDARIELVEENRSPAITTRTGRRVPATRWPWVAGAGASIRIARTRFDERDGQFSPDSKWVAYQSNESGRFEICVQSFPEPGDKWTISRDGGAQPRWSADGKELCYVAFDNRLMAVPIRVAADHATLVADAAGPLFSTRIGGAVEGPNRQQYMVSSDGRRFLMNTLLEEANAPIVVLLNWRAGR